MNSGGPTALQPYHTPVFTTHGTMQDLTALGFAGPSDNAYAGSPGSGIVIPGGPGGGGVS